MRLKNNISIKKNIFNVEDVNEVINWETVCATFANWIGVINHPFL